ncbi:MAG: excinuclease ABC subunit UvrC [Flavobacteriaceae bacterium]
MSDTDTPKTAASAIRGAELIASHVKRLPKGPGVYRMLDAAGDPLYVGKARSLKARVTNYTRPQGQPFRIQRMIAETAAMEFVSTNTETEALLLEANMIKRLRPRYNVLMRDDKSFPYILIARDHPAPPIVKHRGARNRKGDYFGPFASAGAVNRTLNALERAFLLRSCSDTVYETRTRPCLLFQIKRCSAPCTGEIDPAAYQGLVDQATAFLTGKSQNVREALSKQMQEASEALDFERAAVYRDRLQALSHIQSQQGINPRGVREADVFACHQDGGQSCIQVFFFRAGQNWGNRAYFPKADKTLEPEAVLESFVTQFYDDKPAPREIYMSHAPEDAALIGEALGVRAGHRVSVHVPQRGEKRALVEDALANAREALGRRLAETGSQARMLEGVADIFNLDGAPERIEIYDNSHIMGTGAVGGMVVAGPEGFEKNQYRKFNMKGEDLAPGDDYGMMREMLQRRFARLLKEMEGDSPPPVPDLVLIDGGAGQLSAATAVMEELGLSDIPLVAIAKGEERDAGREKFFLPGAQPVMLPPRDPVLYFLQRLRDEAHRFAIGSHRARRARQIHANPLDDIAGIGPTRKRALLHHFGSAKAVSRAALADLEAAPGISARTARQIYDHFHEKG